MTETYIQAVDFMCSTKQLCLLIENLGDVKKVTLDNLMGPRVKQGQYGDISVIIRLQIWSDEEYYPVSSLGATVGTWNVVPWCRDIPFITCPLLPPHPPAILCVL